MRQKSLYELIDAAVLKTGSLPENFELPKDRTENKVVFADGAQDGIFYYHSAGSPSEEIGALRDSILLACQGKFEEAILQVHTFFENNYALSVIDVIQTWIVEHREELNINYMYQLSSTLVKESANREAVKFGLTILELFNTSDVEEIRKLVLTLGLSDEFTLFSLFVMQTWTDANEKIFALAQKLSGWGKIHAVERLEPESEEIKEWLLCAGCQNTIMNEYLALTCAQKCELANRIQKSMSEEEFTGAEIILSALLGSDEGPLPGIEAYADDIFLLKGYLYQLESREPSIQSVFIMLQIKEYLECKKEGQEILQSIEEKLTSTDIKSKILQEIQAWRPYPALCIAKQLSIDVSDALFEKLREYPIQRHMVLGYLIEFPGYAEKLTALYEDTLPLKEMSSGVDDLSGLGKEFENYGCLIYLVQFLRDYPLVGTKLLETALNAPVVNNRTMSARVLESWCEKLNCSVREISPRLYEIVKQNMPLEKEGEHKKRLEKLLSL